MKKLLMRFCFGAILSFILVPYAAQNVQAKEAELYADFAISASANTSSNKTKKVPLDAITVEALAKELSAWTGLDFTLNKVTTNKDAIIVDWSPQSTLIANLDNRKQKEEFHFFDADSLRWFMMNSLLGTIQKNFGDVVVYYTMDGGKDLTFEELSLVKHFPKNSPFMGSAFYDAHADVKGD